MELIEFLGLQLADVHRMTDICMNDLSEEVITWRAAETRNPIGRILAHMVSGQDIAINGVIRGGEPLHNAWAARTGIPMDRTQIWQSGWQLHLDAFNDYRLAVQESARAGVAGLTEADLDQPVEWRGMGLTVSTMLKTIVLNHALGHCGEISALKGVQGLKGLPM